MAKVTGPLHSTQASGKVGSLIYARNQYGAYSRSATAASDPNTSSQQAWRDALSFLSNAWEQSLNQIQRDGWNQFGLLTQTSDRFGQTVFKSGRHWFIKFNIFRRVNGLGLRNFPPVENSLKYSPAMVLDQNENGIFLTIDPEPTGEALLYVSKVPAQNLGRSFPPNLQVFSRWIDSGDAAPFIVRPNNELTEELKRYFFKVVVIDDFGIPSKPFWFSFDAELMFIEESLGVVSSNSIYQSSPTFVDDNPINLFCTADLGGNNVHSILRFDFSSINITNVSSASLGLYCFQKAGEDDGCDVWALAVNSILAETSWDDRATSTAWSSGGATGVADRGAAPIASLGSITLDSFNNFDVTDWVQDVLDATVTNNGLLVSTSVDSASFAFRSQTFGNPDLRPVLSIIGYF